MVVIRMSRLMAEIMPFVRGAAQLRAQGIAYGCDGVAYADLVGAELRRGQTVRLYLQDARSLDAVYAHEQGFELSVVPERHRGGIGALDDVGVRSR